MTAEKLVAGPLRGQIDTLENLLDSKHLSGAQLLAIQAGIDALRALASLPSSPLREKIEALREQAELTLKYSTGDQITQQEAIIWTCETLLAASPVQGVQAKWTCGNSDHACNLRGYCVNKNCTEFSQAGQHAEGAEAEEMQDFNAKFGGNIFVVTGEHQRTAFFSKDAAEEYLAQQNPERFKIIVYEKPLGEQRELTAEQAEKIDEIISRHKTDEFDSFHAADDLSDYLFGGVNYPGIFAAEDCPIHRVAPPTELERETRKLIQAHDFIVSADDTAGKKLNFWVGRCEILLNLLHSPFAPPVAEKTELGQAGRREGRETKEQYEARMLWPDLTLRGKATDHIWVMEDVEGYIGVRLDCGDSGTVYLTKAQAADLAHQLAALGSGQELREQAANIALNWSNNLAKEWERSRVKGETFDPPGKIAFANDAKRFAAEMLANVYTEIRALALPLAPKVAPPISQAENDCNVILRLMGKEPYLAKGHVEDGEYKWVVVADKISVTEMLRTATAAIGEDFICSRCNRPFLEHGQKDCMYVCPKPTSTEEKS